MPTWKRVLPLSLGWQLPEDVHVVLTPVHPAVKWELQLLSCMLVLHQDLHVLERIMTEIHHTRYASVFCMTSKCLIDAAGRLLTMGCTGWTTRGRHHSPIFQMFVCLTTSPGLFPCPFARSEVGSFTCTECDSPSCIHKTDSLKSPPKDQAMRIKRLAKGHICQAGVGTRDLQYYGSPRSYSICSAMTAPH